MLGCKRGISGVRNLPAMADGGAGTCGAAARRREGQRGKVGTGQRLTMGRLVLLGGRGSMGFSELTTTAFGARGRRRRCSRRCRASGEAWLVEDEAGDDTELGEAEMERGSGCGRGVTAARPWRLRPWRGTSEGEVLGANGGSRGSGRRRGGRPEVQGRGRQAGGAVASSCSSVSPLCLPGEDEAAGWHGPAQCWACQVGCQVGCGQVSSLLLFYFLFSIFL